MSASKNIKPKQTKQNKEANTHKLDIGLTFPISRTKKWIKFVKYSIS